MITQDSSGNIGIGTTTPGAKLHVVGGNVILDNSSPTTGNILKVGLPFLHNSGLSNTFVGLAAGNLTLSGGFNTASGESALRNITTGGGNTAHGFGALFGNTSGNNNTGTGVQTLNDNTSGSSNTANGFQALFHNTIGDNNTASGANALLSNTTGRGNTASGTTALSANTTGIGNTASGSAALVSNTNGGGNTASGSSALANNTTGSSNTASGFAALFNNITGGGNTASGVNALESNTTGSGNTALGYQANVSAGDLTNATAIGNGAIVNASNKVRVGNANVTVIEGQVGFTASSDVRQKENFRPVDGEKVLGKIRGLPLTSWNFIGHDPKQFRHYGPMAQDFFAAFGHDGVGRIGTDTTITSTDMDGILMIAAQALEMRTVKQQHLIGKQERRIDALQAENAQLKARLEALERRTGDLALTKAE